MFGFEEVADFTAFGRDRIATDGGRVAFGNAIEGEGQRVIGVFSDLLATGGVLVVEDFFGAEGFKEGVVAGGGGGDDSAARQNSVLDSQGACCCAAAVDEEEAVVLLHSISRLWKSKALIHRLTASDDGRP